MADGHDTTSPTEAGQEPSMEEILASIRKIISDDEVPPAEGAEPAPAEIAEASAPIATPINDVIELTQMVQDDGSVIDVNTLPAEEPPPPPPAPEPVVMETVPVPEKPLVSDTTVSSSASALSALANTVEIERLSNTPLSGTALGNGSRTLEDMVIELMRPLLKEWLEQNLPSTVDRLVQKEIERISRKAQN